MIDVVNDAAKVSNHLESLVKNGAVLTVVFSDGQELVNIPISWLRYEPADGGENSFSDPQGRYQLDYFCAYDDREHRFLINGVDENDDTGDITFTVDGGTIDEIIVGQAVSKDAHDVLNAYKKELKGQWPVPFLPGGWLYGDE